MTNLQLKHQDIYIDLAVYVIMPDFDIFWFIKRGYLGDCENLCTLQLSDLTDNDDDDKYLVVGFDFNHQAYDWLDSLDEGSFTCMNRQYQSYFADLINQITES